MALRDYLNFESTADFANFVLQNGQAVAIVTMDGVTPLETWYYNASSMAVPNGTTVFKPNAVSIADPGRYIKNMTASDWNTTINKPIFADVALSGDYNDLDNKLTAGNGILIDNNSILVDETQFMTAGDTEAAIANLQAEIDTKAEELTTITVNGITQTLEANRDWEVGDVSTSEIYTDPSWLILSNLPTSTQINTWNGKQNTVIAGSGITKTGDTIAVDSTQIMTVANANSAIATMQGNINQKATLAEARAGLSLTTTGTSGASTYNNATGVFNIPNYSYTPPSRIFNNNVARTLNSNYTISTTRDASVTYSISLSVTNPLVAGSSTASAFLEYSTNAGSSWITVSQAINTSSVGVAVAIAITQPNTFVLSGNTPANALVRIRTTTSGTASATYTLGSETLL
jgi:hypothetical protein